MVLTMADNTRRILAGCRLPNVSCKSIGFGCGRSSSRKIAMMLPKTDHWQLQPHQQQLLLVQGSTRQAFWDTTLLSNFPSTTTTTTMKRPFTSSSSSSYHSTATVRGSESPRSPPPPPSLQMPSSYYRLFYFDLRGAVESIRYLFALTGVPYQDIRYPIRASAKGFGVDTTFQRDQEKGMFQSNMGKLPILQVIQNDDEVIIELGQSDTILRFLANHHGAMGKNSLERAYIDMIIECIRDIKTAWYKAKKQSRQREFLQTDLVVWCEKLEAALPLPIPTTSSSSSTTTTLDSTSSSSSPSPWLVGDQPSIADISVYAMLATPTSIMTGSSQSFFDGASKETIESAYRSTNTTTTTGRSNKKGSCPRLTQSVQAMSQLKAIQQWEKQRPDTFN